MIARTQCAKCGSHKIIPEARIWVRGPSDMTNELQVEVNEKPNALLFKGAHYGVLRAWICGTCGFTELYVNNPEELYTAYEKNLETGR
ncbi:MAG TPA: hypothetical protein VKU00_25285 [Chthonomonadaceae bacterium]|nr:hypothetical protein [Chthonomonadaceae bacterium]